MTETGERLPGEAATVALGRALGEVLEVGDLLAIDGDLGAGKTTLVRGLAAGLGADPGAVRSPTFVLARVYRDGRIPLHHLDTYRLGPQADLRSLDLDDLLGEGAVALEWARWASLDLPPTARIQLEAPTPAYRRVVLASGAPERLRRAFGAGLEAARAGEG